MNASKVLLLLGVAFSSVNSTASAQLNDTINGIVTDSLLGAVMDSVNVASEGISVKTKSGGTFQLVFVSTVDRLITLK